MMEALRPSIEEAQPISSQELALDYIGKRSNQVGVPRAQRVAYARDILQKELLPHVGQGQYCEGRKAYYLGYMVRAVVCVGGVCVGVCVCVFLQQSFTSALFGRQTPTVLRVLFASSQQSKTINQSSKSNQTKQVHRLLLVALRRRREDDRDHYACKRLDLGGPLLAGLFRLLFRKLCKDVRSYVQRAVDAGKEVRGVWWRWLLGGWPREGFFGGGKGG
jgi:DNA-directed RNA polymerase beta subunit